MNDYREILGIIVYDQRALFGCIFSFFEKD